jgi:hypothetical protein
LYRHYPLPTRIPPEKYSHLLQPHHTPPQHTHTPRTPPPALNTYLFQQDPSRCGRGIFSGDRAVTPPRSVPTVGTSAHRQCPPWAPGRVDPPLSATRRRTTTTLAHSLRTVWGSTALLRRALRSSSGGRAVAPPGSVPTVGTSAHRSAHRGHRPPRTHPPLPDDHARAAHAPRRLYAPLPTPPRRAAVSATPLATERRSLPGQCPRWAPVPISSAHRGHCPTPQNQLRQAASHARQTCTVTSTGVCEQDCVAVRSLHLLWRSSGDPPWVSAHRGHQCPPPVPTSSAHRGHCPTPPHRSPPNDATRAPHAPRGLHAPLPAAPHR